MKPARPGVDPRTIARRGVARLVVVLLVALGGWSATASSASAHNVLRSTSPADSSTVDTVPAEVVLTFDEPAIAMGTTIVVTGPDGAVSDGSPRLVDNTVSQPLKPGAPAGEYTVEWRVTSADGHPITGTFAFSARSAATNAAGPSPAASASGGTTEPGRTGAGIPGWVWPVIAAMLLLSAVTSAAIARRRRRSR